MKQIKLLLLILVMLFCSVTGYCDEIITFADANVEAICVANWDTNGDRKLSREEAAAVPKLNGVFYENSQITSFNELQYFTGIKEIQSYEFYHCTSLTSIILPSELETIGSDAFCGCSLETLIIPNKVTSIGSQAFVHCKFSSVSIPSSLTSMGNRAFQYCSNLNAIHITDIAAWINIDYPDRSAKGTSAMEMAKHLYLNGEEVKNLVIPEGITSISDVAFRNCLSITSVQIPSSVTRIGDVFYECSNLVSVSLPDNFTSIGMNAFRGCTSLSSINLPAGLTSIESMSFMNCISLKSINIPESVTSIGDDAFNGCSSLTSIYIPKGVTNLSYSTFGGCVGLTSIKVADGNPVYDSRNNCNAIIETASNMLIKGCSKTIIPNNVTSIGSCAFSGCSNLKSISLPNSVISIGHSAFYSCTGLTTITIPNSVTSIARYAFYDINLKSVVSQIEEPFKIDWHYEYGSFSQYTFDNSTLYVPTGTIRKYKATDGWREFKNIVEVGLTLNKSKASIDKGKTMSLKATVSLPDQSVTWKSSNTAVATVSSKGKVTGVKAGTATITCTSVSTGLKATCKVTVGYVKLDQTEAILEKTKTITLTATVYPSKLEDKSVTWRSSNTKVATVTSKGKVKGVKAGTATITCTSNATGLKTTCKITVGYVKLDQTEAILQKTKTLTLTPTVYPSKLEDKSVTWKSSKTSVATVSSKGKITGVKAGTAVITCTSKATGLKTTCTVTVGYVKLNQTEAIIEKGKTKTLKATVYPSALEDKSVTWTSSNTAVATVTSKGKIKGVKAGTATITCTSNATGLKTTCKVTIGYVKLDQTEVTVKKGKTLTLTATVYPSKLTDKSVTWDSSDKTIATVNADGKVKGIKAGTATITCTSNTTGLSTTCTVTVTTTSGSRSMEGNDGEVTGIEEVNERLIEDPIAVEPFDVYDLSGRKVLHQVTSLDGLPNGIYIVNGKKVLKKQ